MPSIELHILTGSHAGRRLLLEQASITIGRSMDNDVVIDLPYVSRRHAELRFDQGQWWLVNHSPNGTRVQRRWVTDQPRAVDDAVSISIGDERVLDAAPQAMAADDEGGQGAPAGEAAGQTQRPGGGMSRRAMLWLGIGAFWALIIGLMIFSQTLGESDDNDDGTAAPELTRVEIAQEIRAEPAQQPPNSRRAQAALEEAREQFNSRESELDARYKALEAYRVAMQYHPDHELPPLDRRRYKDVQDELIEDVAARYRDAYALLQSERYQPALREFRELMQVYPAGDSSEVLNNIEQHADMANRQLQE